MLLFGAASFNHIQMPEVIQSQADFHIASLGQYGIEDVSATDSSTAGNEFIAIIAIDDDAVVDLTLARGGTTSITNVTLTQNVIYVLPITSFTVDSGRVWGYLGQPFVSAS